MKKIALFILVLSMIVITSACGKHEKINSEDYDTRINEDLFSSSSSSYDDIHIKDISNTDAVINEIKIPQNIEEFSEELGVYYRNINIICPLNNNRILLTRERKQEEAFIIYYQAPSDIVIYNYITEEWEEPLNSTSKNELFCNSIMSFEYIDDNYIIVSTTLDPMSYIEGKLILFDLLSGDYKVIYEYPYDKKSEPPHYTGSHPNDIVVFNNKIYFDDFVGEDDCTLYAYDIMSDELRAVRENAINPIVYKNEVWFFVQDENNAYTLLVPESSSDKIKN